MKRLLFLSFLLAFVLPSSAQFLLVTKVKQNNSDNQKNVSIFLSNGERIYGSDSCWRVTSVSRPFAIPRRISDRVFERRWENINGQMVYNCKEGEIVYKSRRGYRFITPQREKDAIIKSIRIKCVNDTCVSGTDYAVKMVEDLCYPSEVLKKTERVKVAYVTFNDGSSVEIITKGDPTWIRAKAGQKVKIHTLNGLFCYKLAR